MLDIKIERTAHPKPLPEDESQLGFAKKFSDHMFVMDYTEGQGWHDPRIVPYQPFTLDPATVVLHYAQEIFEGLKAYRTADDKIQLFRPECNANRMNDSADRLCIPNIPPEDFVQAVKALVEVDKDWCPIWTALPIISVPSSLPTTWAWASTPPSTTFSASSALPPARTTPRASTPCASMWRMSTSVLPRSDRLHQVRRQLRRLHQGR